MHTYTVTFEEEQVSITFPQGTTLLEAQITSHLQPDAPCGGQGTCGKCKVRILSGHSLLTKGTSKKVPVDPMLRSYDITVEKCSPGQSSSDWDQLKKGIEEALSLPADHIIPNIRASANLYETLQSTDYHVNVVLCQNEVLLIRQAKAPCYLTAFDIGTTSIVGYLLDGKTGEELAASSMLNPQS